MANIAYMLTDTLAWDTGFWGSLLGWFNNFITSYGWTIIVFTLLIKLLLTPLDYFQRRNSAKMAIQQKKNQPELDKIREKYKNNPEKMKEKLNAKQMELMRSGQSNVGSTCLFSLIYMVLTCVIFITLFTSMQTIANVQTVNSYIHCENEYERVYAETGNVEKAQDAVYNLYESGECTESWLWIKNIWKCDTSTSVVTSYEEFSKIATKVNNCPYTFEGEDALTQEKYDTVMSKIMANTEGQWNGYYILIVLVGVLTYLSFRISMGGASQQPSQPGAPNLTGILKWGMPILMVLITLFYTAAFALYIFANSLFAVLVTPLYNKILKKKFGNYNFTTGTSNSNNVEVDYKINKITKLED